MDAFRTPSSNLYSGNINSVLLCSLRRELVLCVSRSIRLRETLWLPMTASRWASISVSTKFAKNKLGVRARL